MKRARMLWIALVPAVLTATGFLALAWAAPAKPAQLPPPTPTPQKSDCGPALQKYIDPSKLILGDTTRATLIVSGTCPAVGLPIDLVILADESNSMTRGQPGSFIRTPTRAAVPTEPATPDPRATGPVTPDPGNTPEPPTPVTPGSNEGTAVPGPATGAGEPPFCRPVQALIPTPVLPTGTTAPTERPTPLPGPYPTSTTGPVPPDPGNTPEPPTPVTPGANEGTPRSNVPTPGGRAAEPTLTVDELEPPGGVDKLKDVKDWVRTFLDQDSVKNDMASGRLRVGYASFNDRIRVRQALTDRPSKITAAAGRMRGGNITRIDLALREAKTMLNGTGSRYMGQRTQMVLLLSDFQFCLKHVRTAGRSRNQMQVVTIGFNVASVDLKKQLDLSTKREYALQSRDLKEVIRIYDRFMRRGRPVTVAELTVSDLLSDTMRLVVGSADPPTMTVKGQLLEWHFDAPTYPITVSYRVEPLQGGVQPVSVEALAVWTDTEKLPGMAPFPDVSVEVLMPTPTSTLTPSVTPTPTSTATATPTPTPTPGPKYLPIAFANWPPPTPTAVPTPEPTKCVPEAQTVDVALVIDTSTSMLDRTSASGPRKLDAAISAALELVNLLKPVDQTAVVGFNATATLATRLTSDRLLINGALQSLPGTAATGTHIDKGLRAAFDELVSPRHQPGNNRSIVLVTDGMHTGLGGPDEVRAVANQIRSAGILLVTVGLGSEIDEALLREIATAAHYYYPAPEADDLSRIYREIAHLIPCPD